MSFEHAVLWQVYPLGFVGAEPGAIEGEPRHRLGRIVAWLDHVVRLGASAVLLGPVFASSTHGYDTVDYVRVDPRLGDEADLVALIEAAHARGLRVLLDGVFNHVGQGFDRYLRALEDGPGSESARWFHLHWPEDGGPPTHDDFEGHSQLVALNHEEPAVADFVVEVMSFWLDRGVDGWRLDAAYAVPPRFWAPVLERVRDRHPGVLVVGEVIHGDYPAIVAESGMDSVTQYELWKAVWSSLNDRNAYELAHALDRHTAFAAAFPPQTFVGNHDVTRIASRLDDERHLPHALVVLMTVAGIPSVYAGDEFGFRGVKEDRVGGDDAVRPAFPDSPEELDPVGLPILRLHQDLIGLRRRHAFLHRARTEIVTLSNTLIAYVASAEGRSLAVALSTDDAPTSVAFPARIGLLLGDAEISEDGRTARLPPHGWACFSVDPVG